MFCPFCGGQIQEGTRFCEFCGSPLEATLEQAAQLDANLSNQPTEAIGQEASALPEDWWDAPTSVSQQPMGAAPVRSAAAGFELPVNDGNTAVMPQQVGTASPGAYGQAAQMPQSQGYAPGQQGAPAGMPVVPGAGNAAGPSGAPNKQPQSGNKGGRAIIAVAAIAVVLVGAIIAGVTFLGGQGSGSSTSSASTGTTSTSSASTSSASTSSASASSAGSSSSAGSMGTSTFSTTSSSKSSASASASSQSSSKSSTAASSSATSTSKSSAASSAIPAEAKDSKGNPSFYAISELDGAGLVALLDAQGFKWDADENAYVKGTNVFGIVDSSKTPLNKDDYAKLNKGGKGTAIAYLGSYQDYGSLDNYLKGQNVVVEDKWVGDDGSGAVVFYGPSMVEYLAVVVVSDDETVLMVFTEDSLKSGLFSSVVNGGTDSYTLDEVWQQLTGGSIGDNVQKS